MLYHDHLYRVSNFFLRFMKLVVILLLSCLMGFRGFGWFRSHFECGVPTLFCSARLLHATACPSLSGGSSPLFLCDVFRHFSDVVSNGTPWLICSKCGCLSCVTTSTLAVDIPASRLMAFSAHMLLTCLASFFQPLVQCYPVAHLC